MSGPCSAFPVSKTRNRLCAGLVALSALMPHSAASQPQQQPGTILEAAALNMQRAMTLCLHNYHGPVSLVPKLEAAGFTLSPEVFSETEVLMWFNTPGETAFGFLVPEQSASTCAIMSNHMSVPQALRFAGAVLAQVFGHLVTPKSPDNINVTPGHPQASNQSCSGYSVLVPRSTIWVQVGNGGQDPVCIDDGTTQILIRT